MQLQWLCRYSHTIIYMTMHDESEVKERKNILGSKLCVRKVCHLQSRWSRTEWVDIIANKISTWGFPGGSSVKKKSACQCRSLRRYRFSLWVGKIPWRRKRQPTQYFCLGNPMDGGALWTTNPWDLKSWTWLREWVTHTEDFYILKKTVLRLQLPLEIVNLWILDTITKKLDFFFLSGR